MTDALPAQGVTLRPFRYPEDYPAALALWQRAGDGVRLGRSDTSEQVAHKLERDPDLFLTAFLGDELVGTVIGGYDGRRGLVYHLAVAPEARRLGIGSLLMDELEARLRQKGCLRAYLLVTRDNLEAQGFYEHRGWAAMDLFIYGKDIQ